MGSSLTLGDNLSSLMIRRQLANANSRVGSSLERLSSGMRITRASDDAAGLAVASSLAADTRVYTQAIRNVNDSVSVFNIADGVTSNLSNITGRLKELAEQAANGSYSTQQRTALDSEAYALTQEFNRLVQSAEFNSLKLLDGSLSRFATQVASSVLSLSLGSELLRTTGSGNFQSTGQQPGAQGVTAVATADFNGDGVADAVSVAPPGSGNLVPNAITVGINNGTGTLNSTNITGSDLGSLGGYTQVQAVDVNGDGIPDVVAGGAYDQGGGYTLLRFDVFLGTAAGSFTYQSGLSFTSSFGNSTDENVTLNSFAVGDTDGDGDADLVYSASNTTLGSHEIRTASNNGSGAFSDSSSVSTTAAETGLAIADLDQNGRGDLVSAASGIKVRLSSAGGSFGSATTYGSGVYFALGDVNHDGRTDIVSDLGSTLSIYSGNGNGGFALSGTHTLSTTGNQVVRLGDTNNDGNLDIVTNKTKLLGNGNGTFVEGTAFSGSIDDVVLGDFSGDGVLDILIINLPVRGLYEFVQSTQNSATIERLDLTTQSSARTALTALDEYIDRIASARSTIGSAQSRLSSVLNTLQSTRTNYENALARIMDADMASEAAELTRGSILQNVASSLLGQANLNPQLALKLLSASSFV